jgi:hypothetical protein
VRGERGEGRGVRGERGEGRREKGERRYFFLTSFQCTHQAVIEECHLLFLEEV